MPKSITPVSYHISRSYIYDGSVSYVMKRVLGSIMQQTDMRLEPHGITHAQWLPLFKLKSTGKPMTVAQLAHEVQSDASAMTRLLDRLEKKGLCKRIRSTEDRRVVMIEPTPDGIVVAALVPDVLNEVLDAHLAGFSDSELKALVGYLHRMIYNGNAMRKEETGGSSPSGQRRRHASHRSFGQISDTTKMVVAKASP
ncbi:marR family protein [Burkholderia cenocepacia]|uniref:MarR family protein n=1 Tax=Burkholderia cenocepacia TaxID=95486 RepID=A0AAN0VMU3_9BURK|nr:marR family protein [Burkholderia cenocepacia]